IMQVEGLRAAGALGGRAERLGAAVGTAQVRHDELTRSDGEEEEEHQRLERADLSQYDCRSPWALCVSGQIGHVRIPTQRRGSRPRPSRPWSRRSAPPVRPANRDSHQGRPGDAPAARSTSNRVVHPTVPRAAT
ncbi:MAG: hypothetical protein ACK55I_42635, partial [bacterium]